MIFQLVRARWKDWLHYGRSLSYPSCAICVEISRHRDSAAFLSVEWIGRVRSKTRWSVRYFTDTVPGFSLSISVASTATLCKRVAHKGWCVSGSHFPPAADKTLIFFETLVHENHRESSVTEISKKPIWCSAIPIGPVFFQLFTILFSEATFLVGDASELSLHLQFFSDSEGERGTPLQTPIAGF